MIHTTVEGDAYIVRKKQYEIAEICVIDQDWSLDSGPLPIDRKDSNKLNQLSQNGKPKIFEFLHGKDFEPRN